MSSRAHTRPGRGERGCIHVTKMRNCLLNTDDTQSFCLKKKTNKQQHISEEEDEGLFCVFAYTDSFK